MNPSQEKPLLNVPVAIVLAAAIIGGAIIWVKKPTTVVQAPAGVATAGAETLSIRPVTSDDHILGNPNARIKLVEYSDPSCPYCKVFHSTMRKIMDAYGRGGNVAWVYRHFPLDKPDQNGNILHPNAGLESQAFECAAEIGGNDKFWLFVNRFYEVTPSVTSVAPNGLDPKELPNIAVVAGLDKVKFVACLESGRHKDKIEADYLDGINGGVEGTPFSFLIMPNGKQIPINGAQPYNTLKNAIDALIVQDGIDSGKAAAEQKAQ